MRKGFCGVFNCISYSNILIEKRFNKQELTKTLDNTGISSVS